MVRLVFFVLVLSGLFGCTQEEPQFQAFAEAMTFTYCWDDAAQGPQEVGMVDAFPADVTFDAARDHFLIYRPAAGSPVELAFPGDAPGAVDHLLASADTQVPILATSCVEGVHEIEYEIWRDNHDDRIFDPVEDTPLVLRTVRVEIKRAKAPPPPPPAQLISWNIDVTNPWRFAVALASEVGGTKDHVLITGDEGFSDQDRENGDVLGTRGKNLTFQEYADNIALFTYDFMAGTNLWGIYVGGANNGKGLHHNGNDYQGLDLLIQGGIVFDAFGDRKGATAITAQGSLAFVVRNIFGGTEIDPGFELRVHPDWPDLDQFPRVSFRPTAARECTYVASDETLDDGVDGFLFEVDGDDQNATIRELGPAPDSTTKIVGNENSLLLVSFTEPARYYFIDSAGRWDWADVPIPQAQGGVDGAFRVDANGNYEFLVSFHESGTLVHLLRDAATGQPLRAPLVRVLPTKLGGVAFVGTLGLAAIDQANALYLEWPTVEAAFKMP